MRLPLVLAILIALLMTSPGCRPAVPANVVREPRTVTIGLLLRRQFQRDPYPKRIFRHIDTVYPEPDGTWEVVGFHNKKIPLAGPLGRIFRLFHGDVLDLKRMRTERTHYINIDAAKQYIRKGEYVPSVTVWVQFQVSPDQAARLHHAWQELAARPPRFVLVGQNCASRAASALIMAGILRPGLDAIGGIDLPWGIVAMLQRQYGKDALTVRTGFFGINEAGQPTMQDLPPQGTPESEALLDELDAIEAEVMKHPAPDAATTPGREVPSP